MGYGQCYRAWGCATGEGRNCAGTLFAHRQGGAAQESRADVCWAGMNQMGVERAGPAAGREGNIRLE